MRIERDQKSKERKERKQAIRKEQRSKKSGGPLDPEEYDAILYESIKDVKEEILHGTSLSIKPEELKEEIIETKISKYDD